MALTQKRLRPEVERWIKTGLLDPAQEPGILALYPERRPQYGLIAFAVIGALLILGGISLVIASNWRDIPPLVKLGSLLVMLVGSVGLGTEAMRRGWSRAWAECAFLAASILPLLGIMLISQIFSVQGKPTGLFLLWTGVIAAWPVLTRTLSSWILLLIALMCLLGAALLDYGNIAIWRGNGAVHFFGSYVLFGAACVGVASGWRYLGERTLAGVSEFWGIVVAFLAAFLLGCWPAWLGVWALVFAAALVLVYLGYERDRPHQVNLGFVFVGLTILGSFLRLIGTMFHTGLVFIVGGVVMLAMVGALNHLRQTLIRRMS